MFKRGRTLISFPGIRGLAIALATCALSAIAACDDTSSDAAATKSAPKTSDSLASGIPVSPPTSATSAAAPESAPAPVSQPAPEVIAKADAEAPPIRVLLFPVRETTLVAQMVGKITAVPDTIGATVEKGAAVVQFDCDELRARVDMSKAEFNAAKESHEAKIRLQGLQSAGEVEVALAAAALEKARAQLDLSNVQMRACVVAAPFSGKVVKLHVKRFQGVNVGAPLVDVVAAGQPRMRLNVPSKWLSWLKVGAKFTVDIDETAKSYPARVVALNARVDAVSQSIELEAEALSKHNELLPGMSGTAKFDVPASAAAR